jgi:hypothetical protein
MGQPWLPGALEPGLMCPWRLWGGCVGPRVPGTGGRALGEVAEDYSMAVLSRLLVTLGIWDSFCFGLGRVVISSFRSMYW